MARPTRGKLLASAAVLLTLAGCAAKVADSGAEAASDHPEVPLRRLSKTEFANTTRDLIAALDPQDAAELQSQLGGVVDQYPDDQVLPLPSDKRGGFDRFDQALTESHVDIGYAFASQLGGALTSSPDRIRTVFGECAASATAGPDCVAAFIRGAAERILRRPATDADVAFYAAPTAKGVTPDSLADVLTLMVSSPDFMGHVEVGTNEGTATTRKLTLWEQASRLSYHFWETMPDAELRAAAHDGTLADPDVYAKQVDRLYADPRTQTTLTRFFAQWLRTSELPPLDALNQNPIYQTLAGANLPSHTLHDDALREIDDLAAWVTAHDGTVADLLTDRRSFARSAELAALYGAPAWDGQSEPATVSDPARAGLLTRVAFVASGGLTTNPILKGVRIRQALLCEHIPPPPAAAANAHVDPSPVATTRQVTETITEQPSSVCYSCHANVINGLGYATENFDPLGRTRSSEMLFDHFGNEVGRRTVDTRSVPHVLAGDSTVSNGPGDLTALIASSGKLEFCFARQYFRFALGRLEAPDADAATLSQLDALLGQKRPMSAVFKAIANSPAFKTKTFAGAAP